jgi:hypothetical protein
MAGLALVPSCHSCETTNALIAGVVEPLGTQAVIGTLRHAAGIASGQGQATGFVGIGRRSAIAPPNLQDRPELASSPGDAAEY